ncbi:hypothetical protein T484DRAFT_1799688 [Baffinella frigidus]|nr:hypothetical protein T484DRAFT_1799688 [Cryptophyta sp. CCMP2293]
MATMCSRQAWKPVGAEVPTAPHIWSRDGSRSPAAKKKKKDKKDKKKEKDDAPGDKDGDISEASALRASLGLKPLANVHANALRASLGLKPLANVDDWKKKKPH